MRKGISANIRFRIIFCLCLTLVLLLGGTVAAGAEPDTEQPQAFGFWGSFVTYPDPGKCEFSVTKMALATEELFFAHKRMLKSQKNA